MKKQQRQQSAGSQQPWQSVSCVICGKTKVSMESIHCFSLPLDLTWLDKVDRIMFCVFEEPDEAIYRRLLGLDSKSP